MKKLIATIAAATMSLAAGAHPYKPGDKQSEAILLKGGTVHTVTQGVLKNTDVLFQDGKIIQVASNLAVKNAKVIDVSGKHVYPGLTAMVTPIGLTEIGAVRSTRDSDEVGSFNPEVQAHVAFNTDSEIIPTVRSNGITHAQVAPNGNGVAGQSSLMHLDGWNWEDALVKANLGVHMDWPRVAVNTAWWESRSPEKQKEAMKKQREQLNSTFEQAKAYAALHDADSNAAVDIRYHAFIPVLKGDAKLFVYAEDARQIEQAVYFAKRENLKLVIVGGADAWKVKELLAKENVPVIYTSPYGLPNRTDEGYDKAFTTPAELDAAGVKVTLSIPSAWSVRNLPWAIGQSISFGLDYEQALRMNTMNAAEILGVADQLGSIEQGKSASLVVTSGDMFNYLTHKVEHMYIDGREVDLNNRHKTLYNKYKQKSL